VEWLGSRNDVAEWLRQSSVFVLPSYREGVPRSTLEAMACGLPIVTTDVPGCRETVEPGANGYLVPPRDSKSLAGAILSLCADPNLRQRMGECSRRFAVEKFDVRKVNQEMAEIMGLKVSAGDFR
jgi:glycosyltransferase involved in cell wall biosynthesis